MPWSCWIDGRSFGGGSEVRSEHFWQPSMASGFSHHKLQEREPPQEELSWTSLLCLIGALKISYLAFFLQISYSVKWSLHSEIVCPITGPKTMFWLIENWYQKTKPLVEEKVKWPNCSDWEAFLLFLLKYWIWISYIEVSWYSKADLYARYKRMYFLVSHVA